MRNFAQAFSLIIVTPVFNEQGNIQHFIKKLREEINYDFDLLLVDDGSRDKSLEILKTTSEADSKVKYISLSRNFGHQVALRAGLDHARNYDIVVMMDSDLQHPPNVVNELIQKWQEGFEIVYTKRLTGNESFTKKTTSKLFYYGLNKLTDFKIEEGAADFRLMDKKTIADILAHEESEIFLRGLIPYLGYKQACIEYTPADRFSGETKYTFKKMARLAMSGITSFSDKPLFISIYLGFAVTSVALIYLIYVLVIKLSGGPAVSGWASVIGAIVLLGGTQLITIGILGIYIGKIFFEVKRRPHYFVKEKNI